MPHPTIQLVDHVQVNVTDLAKAHAFYTQVLGLSQIPRPASFTFAGAWYRMGNMDLHLVVRPEEGPSTRHFCVWVTDVHEAARVAESAGFRPEWEQVYKIPGVDRFFIHDPSGNRIEVQGTDAGAKGTRAAEP